MGLQWQEDRLISFFHIATPLLMAASPIASGQCEPIDGWEQVLAEEVRWIVIGEVHGTNEVPNIFADAICQTTQSGPVVVAVEQPSIDQPEIDRFIASDGGEEAKHDFLAAAMWNVSMKDGRSSAAYFRLFEELRRMHASGLIEAVVAFQPSSFTARPTPEEYEKAMADLLVDAARPGTRMIALVGSIHAMRTEVQFQSAYLPMAAHLPQEETITLNTIGNGGEAWNCRGSEGCGSHPLQGARTERSRGVELAPAADGAYSGMLYLGSRTTASLPQEPPPVAGSDRAQS